MESTKLKQWGGLLAILLVVGLLVAYQLGYLTPKPATADNTATSTRCLS